MSDAELLLATQLDQAGIPFEREYKFAPEEWCREAGFVSPKRNLPRKWRADFRVFEAMLNPSRPDLLVEVEGGAYVAGRHTRGSGFEKDTEKYAAAAILGYRVIRVTPRQVNDGRALSWIRQALGMEEAA